MQQVTLGQAKIRLIDLVEAAVHGEEVFIQQDARRAVQLVPRVLRKLSRTFGSAKGLITMAEDFDAELPDFKVSNEVGIALMP